MKTAIPWYRDELPYLTVRQMIEVDKAMVEDFRINLVRMMENAGRGLAHLTRARFLGGDPRGKKVVVLAGTGGNGGGALVCARELLISLGLRSLASGDPRFVGLDGGGPASGDAAYHQGAGRWFRPQACKEPSPCGD